MNFARKTPLEKERFARWAIRLEKRAGHDLTTEVGTKSRTDVFEGMDNNPTTFMVCPLTNRAVRVDLCVALDTTVDTDAECHSC